MVRGAAGEQTFPTEMWSLGTVVDAGIFVDNGSAYIVTVGSVQEGEWEERGRKMGFRVKVELLCISEPMSPWFLTIPPEVIVGSLWQLGTPCFTTQPFKLRRYSWCLLVKSGCLQNASTLTGDMTQL